VSKWVTSNVRSMAVATLLSSQTLARDPNNESPPHTRVQVIVDCDDSALKNRIVSFISRELRSLGDVDITDVAPMYKISIVAIAVRLRSGYTAGHAVSTVISSPLVNLDWALSDELTPEAKKSLSEMLAAHESLDDHRVFVGNEEALRASLEELIADFDAAELEPTRRFLNNP